MSFGGGFYSEAGCVIACDIAVSLVKGQKIIQLVKKRIFNSRKKVSLRSLPLYQVKKNEHRCGQHNTRDVTPQYDQRMCFLFRNFSSRHFRDQHLRITKRKSRPMT
jgi:hypothetical protein